MTGNILRAKVLNKVSALRYDTQQYILNVKETKEINELYLINILISFYIKFNDQSMYINVRFYLITRVFTACMRLRT